MQMTPGQLSGGPKYSAGTLLGNWSEEISLNKAKLDDFKARSASGSSNLRKLQNKVAKCSTMVPLVYSPDGNLRFGDSVMIGNLHTSSVLVCDPFTDNIPGMGVYRVAAAADANEPVARNTYTVFRPPNDQKNFADDEQDPVLRIGQAFCLGCNENLLANSDANVLDPQLYLASTKKTERTSTKSSNRQMVFLSSKLNADAIWTLMPPSRGKIGSSERFLAIGQPVFIGDAFMLVHRQTNTNLTVDMKRSEVSEFGVEYECYNDRTSSFGKLGVIVAEFNGTCTGESLSKPDAIDYYWSLITATVESSGGACAKENPPFASVESLLAEVRQVALGKGAQGFSALRLLFIVLDLKTRVNDGKLDDEDVKESLLKWGFRMDNRFLEILLSSHNSDNSGLVNYREYLDFLRGPLSNRRLDLLQDTYSSLESFTPGTLTPASFQTFFNADAHPLVRDGVCSANDLRKYFTDSLSFREKVPATISFIAFVDFFSDLCVGDDEAFEAILSDMVSTASLK